MEIFFFLLNNFFFLILFSPKTEEASAPHSPQWRYATDSVSVCVYVCDCECMRVYVCLLPGA